MALSDKVVQAFPNAESEVDRVLETIQAELDTVKESITGEGLVATLFAAVMTFFQQLKENRAKKDIESAMGDLCLAFLYAFDELNVKPLNNPSVQQILDLVTKLKEAEGATGQAEAGRSAEAAKVSNLRDEIFAVETALEQRRQESRRQRDEIDRLGGLLIQARQAEVDAELRITSLVEPVLQAGTNEMEYLRRLSSTIEGLHSLLATGMGQLAESLKAQAPQPIILPAPAPKLAVADVSAEIELRVAWLASANDRLDEMGAEIQTLSTDMATMDDLIKYADGSETDKDKLRLRQSQLQAAIDALIRDKNLVSDELRRLQAYRRAAELISAGVPPAMGQELPSLAEAPAETEDPPPDPVDLARKAERFAQLEALGKQFALHPFAVFVISLYESLPQNAHRKAVPGVLKAAADSGLAGNFGLPKTMVIIANWRDPADKNVKFLRWGGGFAGGIYLRSDETLGWDVRQIFTSQEIDRFAAEAAKKSTDK